MNHKQLFLFNRDFVLDPMRRNSDIIEFERQWIQNRLEKSYTASLPQNYSQLHDALQAQLQVEVDEGDGGSAEYVASKMTNAEFKVLVSEFAVDGLTEAQVFYYILPRLPLPAQMPMLRIMIDEFGSGNLDCAHTTLYINLLQELGMPIHYEHYLIDLDDSSFEFVNFFYWLCMRSDDPSWFVGALTYLETIIPDAFDCMAQACNRLNIQSHAYYTEHQHIDFYHAQEGLRILKAMDRDGVLDYCKALKGIMLASLITRNAFEGAVKKARKCNKMAEPVI